MPLKNAYSEAPLENIFRRIETILTSHGAEEFTFETDKRDRKLRAAIRFAYEVEGRLLHFRMEASVDQVRAALSQRARNPREMREMPKNAYRVAWATIRDWLDVQMALIDIHQADLEQIFLPYAIVNEEKQTVYDVMRERQFRLALPGDVEGEVYHQLE